MKVKDLLSILSYETIFCLVDATKGGYMVAPTYIIEADSGVVRERYGDKIVVGFEAVRKNRINLYVK